MKVLLVNKFLYPNGGSETYVFKLGQSLAALGHEVEYFGMEHADRIVGNRAGAYTSGMDFHGASAAARLLYSFKTIYSSEARKKIRLVLDDFRPDVCHLNNFNYQLTPSIILEIKKWSRESNHPCRIVYTAHDYQLICPNHMCYNPGAGKNCERCIHHGFLSCVKGKCIHGSTLKSAVGALEAMLWKAAGVYRHLDSVICCSRFIKQKLDTNPVLAERTVALHNFIDGAEYVRPEKQDYVLYFGRYTQEKGIGTLLEVCRQLPEIPFVFAGSGPLEERIGQLPNIRNVGFQDSEGLKAYIRGARFTVYPSEWNENCPFSVMESQMYGTAVLGANGGGIPELIAEGITGELFTPGDVRGLKEAILRMWERGTASPEEIARHAQESYDTARVYAEKMVGIYRGETPDSL